MLLAVAACATLTDDNFQAKLATQYATIKIVNGDPDKADRIVEIASEIQRYASGETLLTVDLLVFAIKDQIQWNKLDVADTLLVNALLDQLRTELVARLGADALPGDVRLAVDVVAAWVISAAEMA